MNDLNTNTIIEISEWLALPLTYFALTILFFLFVVRPFFAYLFSLDRIKAEKAAEAAKKKNDFIEQHVKDVFNDGDETVPFDKDGATREMPDREMSDSEKMGKLAGSDPEKAGDLVKQWLKKEKS